MLAAGASDHSPMRLAKVCSVNLFSRSSFIAFVLSVYLKSGDLWTNVSPRVRKMFAARKAGPVSTCYMAAANVDGDREAGVAGSSSNRAFAALCLRTRIPGLLSALYNQPA